MKCDVTIVGGGSAGLIAAKEIAAAGYEVCVIEEHQEIGYPAKCSGLFSVSGLKALGLSLDSSLIATTIKGGRFYSPGGKEFTAYSDVERARVVERKMFDKFLAREAARTGAEIMLKTKVKGIKLAKDVSTTISGVEGESQINSELVIGADGVKSSVARWANLKIPNKIIAAAQVEVESADVEQDIAEIYLGRKYAPNFYAWILPKGEVYEIGVGIRGAKGNPLAYLKKFMKEHPIASKKITGKSILEVNIGAIPVGYPVETVKERVMIVGDAAGQVKASTGGGVITGGLAATLAAKASIKALEAGDFSKGFLKREYEDKWKKEIGNELRVHSAMRDLFDAMSDSQLDKIFDIAIKEKINELMVKYPDTDRPSEFVKELLKNKIMSGTIQKIFDLKGLL